MVVVLPDKDFILKQMNLKIVVGVFCCEVPVLSYRKPRYVSEPSELPGDDLHSGVLHIYFLFLMALS